MLIVLTVMIYVFGVPVRGSILLLILLSMLSSSAAWVGLACFNNCQNTSRGLAVCVHHHAAVGATIGIHVPALGNAHANLSGDLWYPVTYFIEILRGVVLRAADLADLLPWIGGWWLRAPLFSRSALEISQTDS